MRRQSFFILIAAIALLLTSSVATFAQHGELRGRVVIKQADGKTVPLGGAVIDVYRTDLKAKYETKADSKGNYVFAGLPFIGTYVIAVSGPGARPQFIPGIKAGRGQDVNLTLEPGDGKRPPEEEVRAAAAAGGSSAPSAEDSAKIEELKRKNKEIEESNKKTMAAYEVVKRTFEAGRKARGEKRYDDAIAQFDEGLAADQTEAALWTEKSDTLIKRGGERYNSANKLSDEAAKKAALETSRKDWKDAVDAAQKAVELLKAQQSAATPEALAQQKARLLAALRVRMWAYQYLVKYFDKDQADAGFTAHQEYIQAESDAAQKSKAQVESAKLYFDAGQYDKASAEFQKILATDPENFEASLWMGLALFNTGDKNKYQEAANHLQRFVDKAPDTNEFKASARESLEYLKTQENVKPVRTTTGGRRRGGN
jgi:tetratricopeptide (TPR) repeat protein